MNKVKQGLPLTQTKQHIFSQAKPHNELVIYHLRHLEQWLEKQINVLSSLHLPKCIILVDDIPYCIFMFLWFSL